MDDQTVRHAAKFEVGALRASSKGVQDLDPLCSCSRVFCRIGCSLARVEAANGPPLSSSGRRARYHLGCGNLCQLGGPRQADSAPLTYDWMARRDRWTIVTTLNSAGVRSDTSARPAVDGFIRA